MSSEEVWVWLLAYIIGYQEKGSYIAKETICLNFKNFGLFKMQIFPILPGHSRQVARVWQSLEGTSIPNSKGEW